MLSFPAPTSLAIEFVIRQVIKYGAATDFSLVAADFSTRVAKLIPGDGKTEHQIIKIGSALILACGVVIHNTQLLDAIVDAAVKGDLDEARKLVVDFLLHTVGAQLPVAVTLMLKAAA